MLYCLNSNFSIPCSLVLYSHIKGSLNSITHLSIKAILVEPNLVCIFLGNNFFIVIMVYTLKNNYFLVRTKLEYLWYTCIESVVS